ncbi:MAG: hypothetical protein JNK87_03020 [Bryobacterales bacterium]|nr:hypothetical protein [Bryobacterales bacterium]
MIKQVWHAMQNLNPKDVRELADRPVTIGLFADNLSTLDEMEEFFSPPGLSRERRLEIFDALFRAGETGAPQRYDIEIYEEGIRRPSEAFLWVSRNPALTVAEILRRRDDLAIPLARRFPPFRVAVTENIINQVSKENAFFSLATALPGIVPSILALPFAVGEFASDTAFLTVNQVRMAFLLAAASDREVGYKEQRNEIGSILAGAFGWRAIARELVGKIPLGGGLIPKAAIAFAGTMVAGRVLERLYREGYEFSKQERAAAYESAFEKGKTVAAELWKSMQAARSAKGTGT